MATGWPAPVRADFDPSRTVREFEAQALAQQQLPLLLQTPFAMVCDVVITSGTYVTVKAWRFTGPGPSPISVRAWFRVSVAGGGVGDLRLKSGANTSDVINVTATGTYGPFVVGLDGTTVTLEGKLNSGTNIRVSNLGDATAWLED